MVLRYPTVVRRDAWPRSATGRVMWCGPFVVCLLLGVDYDEAHRIFLNDMLRTAKAVALAKADAEFEAKAKGVAVPAEVTWTYPHQVERLLDRRGVRCNFVEWKAAGYEKRPTLLRLNREWFEPGKTYLVGLINHWLVVHDGLMYHAPHKPCPVEKAPEYKMARVEMWAEVKARPEAWVE